MNQQWTQVYGLVGHRVLSFTNGQNIAQLHARPYRTDHELWIPVSREEAAQLKWGRVRAKLLPQGKPRPQVVEAVSLALDALNDPKVGTDVP